MAGWDLLSDPGLARSAGLCDAAVGHFDACSGFSSTMGPAQADRALDDPNLAVRLGDRCNRVFDALQMVSSGNVTKAILPASNCCVNALPGRQNCLPQVVAVTK